MTASPTKLADRYDHVIVGGGIAADKAARALHEHAPDASVLILSAATDGPVYRPALTKDLWTGEDPDPASQDLGTAADTGATLVTGVEVTAIDPAERTVTTADGTRVRYGELLLATGAAPRTLDGAPEDPRVVTLREVADYRRLRELVTEGTEVVVVGGGYLGTEIAAGLSIAGAAVTLAISGQAIGEQLFPASITAHLGEVFGGHGVRLEKGFRLATLEAGDRVVLRGEDGRELVADVVVLGLGAQLRTELARAAGLPLSEGGAIVVDEHLRTSAEHVHAAGDVIEFDDPLLGRRHVEHIDHAEASGTAAGTDMAGGEATYAYTPLFYSDLFDDGYEAVGRLDGRGENVELWDEAGTAAVVHHVEDGRIVGVLLWNTWDAVPAARELLADSRAGRIDATDETALRERIAPGG